MLYARELFGFRGDAWLVSIPGYDFAHGEGLSATHAGVGRKTPFLRATVCGKAFQAASTP